jgi:hypothetical protein
VYRINSIYLLQGGSANLSEGLEHTISDYKGWLGLGELIWEEIVVEI